MWGPILEEKLFQKHFYCSKSGVRLVYWLWYSMGCWVFNRRVQNKKDFCLRIKIPIVSYWILRMGVVSGDVSKSAKIWLSRSIFYVKIIQTFSLFFIEEYVPSYEHFLCFWCFLIHNTLFIEEFQFISTFFLLFW